ncbi:MAG: DUF5680 domain-containing protein [bacterium]|nr:DUF5680 domain-containing protein [bacterium]
MSEAREEILLRAQAAFFQAMLAGYVSGAKANEVLNMPGHKGFEFESSDGSFRVLDCYCVYKPPIDYAALEHYDPSKPSVSKKSAGTTTIWFCDRPIWFMNYRDSYREEHVPLLKSALKRAYSQADFVGGRGQRTFQDKSAENLLYINNVESGSTFENFKGHEFINEEPNGIVGQHDYWGMALI